MFKAAVLAISLSSPIAHSGDIGSTGTVEQPLGVEKKENWGKFLEVCFEMDNTNSVSACSALIDRAPLSKKYIGLIHGYRGYAHLFKQNFDIAIEDFSAALDGENKKPEFYNGRGMAQEKLGKHTKALEDYSAAIKANPLYAQAFDNRGQLYRRMNNFKLAIQDLTKATALRPGVISSYYQLGFTYHKQGEYKRAIEIYTLGLKINAKDANLYAKRALSHRWSGDVKAAIKDYSKAIEINPQDPVYYNNRAWAFMLVGKLDNGLQDANKAIGIEAKSSRAAAFYDTRGHIHEALGNKDKAIADFKNAVKINPVEKYISQLRKRGVKH